jgi:aldose 1-epimerase
VEGGAGGARGRMSAAVSAAPARGTRTGCARVDGVPVITLAAGDLEAAFAPGLGMAGVSLRHAGDELLDRQAGLRAYAERGAVMGIPLLHPWANRLAAHGYVLDGRAVRLAPGPPLVRCDEHGLPIHGLLGASPHWHVSTVEAGAAVARLRAELDLGAHPELIAAFPFPHVLAIDATLNGQALTVRTTLRATGGVGVPVAFGYHPYLRLPGGERSQWHIALPRRRHLATDARGIPAGAGVWEDAFAGALGARSFDDGYDGLRDGAAFALAGGGRTITMRLVSGYPAAQIFTPPGGRFVCFEPMTAPTNALRSGAGLRRVAPGAAFEAVFSIEVAGG